jgi:hypothetical protein
MEKKKYVCMLPTDGYQPGQEAWLTEDEAANANGGEAEPRFVLAEDQSKATESTPETPSENEVSLTGDQPTDAPQQEQQ